jgi:hypothetical protein
MPFSASHITRDTLSTGPLAATAIGALTTIAAGA